MATLQFLKDSSQEVKTIREVTATGHTGCNPPRLKTSANEIIRNQTEPIREVGVRNSAAAAQ
jgi:hypothetical protein